jgi:hypothetical protein
MRRLISLLSFCLTSLIFVSANAADVQTLLKTPVWYLNYDVSFTASYDTTRPARNGGTERVTITVSRSFSSQEMLDMRGDGPSVYSSMVAADGKAAAPDMQAVLANMESAANWMVGPANYADDATDEEMNAANDARMKVPIGPAKLDYLRIDVCDNCPDEMGTLNKVTRRTTKTSSGNVHPMGSLPLTLEINGKTKKYTLFLTPAYTDMGTMLKWETVQVAEAKTGGAPVETRQSGEVGLSLAPSTNPTINDPNQTGMAMILVKGEIDPVLDKISGERTMPASYQDDQETVNGTLTVHFTLSTTPPAKSGK